MDEGVRMVRGMGGGEAGEMDGRGDQGLDGCKGVGWWLVVGGWWLVVGG